MRAREFPAKWLLLVALTLVVGILGYRSTVAEDEPPREYAFSMDPEVEILQLWSSGDWVTVLSLYGDGRLTFSPPNGPPTEEYHLSYAECDDLIRIVVDGGIMEYDEASMKARMDKRHLIYRSSTDSSSRLTVRLEDYRGPNHDSGRAESIMAVDRLGSLAKHYPEIAEIQALHRIRQELYGHRRARRDGE